jgi:hypothetical protein
LTFAHTDALHTTRSSIRRFTVIIVGALSVRAEPVNWTCSAPP